MTSHADSGKPLDHRRVRGGRGGRVAGSVPSQLIREGALYVAQWWSSQTYPIKLEPADPPVPARG